MDPEKEVLKERGWRQVGAINAAYERGELGLEGWHRAMADMIVPAYLVADNPRAQSGSSGTPEHWEAVRRPITEAMHKSGTFLDVGCACGHLMECIHEWTREDGLTIEPYGLDILPELAGLARARLPLWANRIFEGNGLFWVPPAGFLPSRFTYVRTGLEYVPKDRGPDLLAHLMELLEPGGRLIIGMFTEDRDSQTLELLHHWGYEPAGVFEMRHSSHPDLVRRVIWVEA